MNQESKNAWAALLAATSEMTAKEIWEANPYHPGFRDRVAAAVSQWGGPDVPLERLHALNNRYYNPADPVQGGLCGKIHALFASSPNLFEEIRAMRRTTSQGVSIVNEREAIINAMEVSKPISSGERQVSFGSWRTAPYKPLEWQSIEVAKSEQAQAVSQETKNIGALRVSFASRHTTPVQWANS